MKHCLLTFDFLFFSSVKPTGVEFQVCTYCSESLVLLWVRFLLFLLALQFSLLFFRQPKINVLVWAIITGEK